MDFEQAERQFRELQEKHDKGTLDETAFRVEVAKLMLRDNAGVFWMLDAASGTWLQNRGGGWEPENPQLTAEPQPVRSGLRMAERRRVRPWLALSVTLTLLLLIAAVVVWRLGLLDDWGLLSGRQRQGTYALITIASPPDGGQVALGKKVSIESLIEGVPDLQVVDHVELQVEGRSEFSQTVQSILQPGQTSLFLSPSWRPDSVGDYRVSVLAFTQDGEPLGEASITLRVTEATDEPQSQTACFPDATFVRDVNIPPATAFPPGVWREKVWQVRNSGSCAWGEGYRLALTEGQLLSAPDHVPVPLTAAGESAELRLTFQAPEEPGSYASVWQLQTPDGQFFGPTLSLSIGVEAQVEENPPPEPPTDLQAEVLPDGETVLLTWEDRSDGEDGFRVYREDVEANIGLTRANVEEFRDDNVICGNAYQYYVVAFNASGPSTKSQSVSAVLPACGPIVAPAFTTTPPPLSVQTSTPLPLPAATALLPPTVTTPPILVDQPPTLTLTVTPTEVLASEVFTITFRGADDWGMDRILVWGVDTGIPILDRGKIHSCTATICTGSWPITWTRDISASWTLVALAVDSSGLHSELAQAVIAIRLPEHEP